jgi:hypothetical protein
VAKVMSNLAQASKLALLLITFGFICITSASAAIQVVVQGGTILSVDVPETGILATIGSGNVERVSMTSLPITAVIDGTGNLLQANGPGKIEHYSSGKIRKIGQVGFDYYSSGKVRKIGQVGFDYYSSGKVREIGQVGFDYYSSGKVREIGQIGFDYYSSGKVRKIGQVGFDYYSSAKVRKIGQIEFLYDSQGRFKGTNGYDSAVSITAS